MYRRNILPIIIAVFVFTNTAYAERVFMDGFDSGIKPNASNGTVPIYTYDAMVGIWSTTLGRSSVCDYASTNQGTICAINTQCIGGNCITIQNNSAFAMLGGVNTAETNIITFLNSSGSPTCTIKMAKKDPTGATVTTLIAKSIVQNKLYQCTDGTNDGTACTPCSQDSDCTSVGTGSICVNPGVTGSCTGQCTSLTIGEARCGSAIVAQQTDVPGDAYKDISLAQKSVSAGELKCDLVINGHVLQSTPTKLGTCSIDGFACGNNADCIPQKSLIANRCTPYDNMADLKGTESCITLADCPSGRTACTLQTCILPPTTNLDVAKIRIGTDWDYLDIGAEHFVPTSNIMAHVLINFDNIATWLGIVDDIIIDNAYNPDSLKARRLWFTSSISDVTTTFSRTGCSGPGNYFECLDDILDTGIIDSATTLNKPGTSNSWNSVFELGDFTLDTINGDDPTAPIGGITSSLIAVDSGTGSGNTLNQGLQSCILDASCTDVDTCLATLKSCSTADIVSRNSVYTPMSYATFGGTKFDTVAEVNAARLGIKIDHLNPQGNGPCTSSCNTNITAAIAYVDVPIVVPPPPGVAVDRNNDSHTRLVWIGDSVANVGAVKTEIVSRLQDYTDFVTCSSGSKRTGDVEKQFKAMIDGSKSCINSTTDNGKECTLDSDCAGIGASCDEKGVMNCEAKFGVIGPVDDAIVMIGINSVVEGPAKNWYCESGSDIGVLCDPALNTCTGGAKCVYYGSGYCKGGVDHGKQCECPQPIAWESFEPPNNYCMNANAGKWAQPDIENTCADCSVNSDCDTNIPCATITDCNKYNIGNPNAFSSCTSGTCRGVCGSFKTGLCDSTLTVASYKRGDSGIPAMTNSWTRGGACINVPNCSGGICESRVSGEEIARSFRAMIKIITDREATQTVSDDVRLILVTESRPINKKNQTSAFFAPAFTAHSVSGSALGIMVRKIARDAMKTSNEIGFLDVEHYLEVEGRSNPSGISNFYSDPIHPTSPDDIGVIDKSGAEIIAEAVEKCVEHGTDFLTVSDGVCLSGKCTVGLLGSSCSINSDCDLWDCP